MTQQQQSQNSQDEYSTIYDDKIHDLTNEWTVQKINPEYYQHLTLLNVTKVFDANNSITDIDTRLVLLQFNIGWLEIQLKAQNKLSEEYEKQINQFIDENKLGKEYAETWTKTESIVKQMQIAHFKLNLIMKAININRPIYQPWKL